MNSDLFNVEWTTGNLSMPVVETIAKYLGVFAAAVISIVGFGIVWATILKNAMHGLYAVAPKFWDRVDEVKKAGLRDAGNKISGGNNEVMKLLGSVTGVLLSLLPNVKAMTDFDGEVLDAKAYFMKAIPLMCVNIFVGVFIFFGYPSQVAQKCSEFGTGLFDVVLTNVDPSAWVQSLPDKLAVLKFSTDGSMNEVDKHINKIAKKVANAYVGAVDMTKEKRLEAALAIEAWVANNINDCAEYCNSDKYNMSVTAAVYKTGGEPDISRVHNQVNDGIATFAYTELATNINGGFDPGAANMDEVANWYIRYDLRFTPKASKGDSSTAEVTMSVANDLFLKPDKHIEIQFAESKPSGYGFSVHSAANGVAITSDNKKIKVNISLNNTKLIIMPVKDKDDLSAVTSIQSVQGLAYSYVNSKNKITEISVGGSGITFTTKDGQTWSFGDDPVGAGKGNGDNGGSGDGEEKKPEGGETGDDL